MTDSLFDTLAAVALMCSHHFHGVLSVNMEPIEGSYDQGFERCARVISEFDAEKDRRARAAEDEATAADRHRLDNALAGILGKSFAPETPPPPPRRNDFGCNIMPTYVQDDAVLRLNIDGSQITP